MIAVKNMSKNNSTLARISPFMEDSFNGPWWRMEKRFPKCCVKLLAHFLLNNKMDKHVFTAWPS